MSLSKMKFATFALLGLACIRNASSEEELPITTAEVFVQSGEVSDSSIIIMARCNSEVDSKVSLTMNGDVVQDDQVFEARDYTISFKVDGLESNTLYTYSVECTSLADDSATATSMEASFKTAPTADDAVAFNFVWAADLAGQGWGRNPNFEITNVDGKTVTGGYIVFDTMESLSPEFAIFQGDMIYADGPIPPEVINPLGGANWTNNPSKDFVAVTLDEFRANWKYNFGDEKMQSFLSKTPVFVQWDDHEVSNNWWPNEVLGAPSYAEGTSATSLYANSIQAFYEFNPIEDGQKIYRSKRFGRHVEIFFTDYRSYRDPNSENDNPEGIAMMGTEQLDWLKTGLAESNATWKIISSDDPMGGIVTGSEGDYDSFANERPEILGREFELKDLLQHIYDNDIRNVISLTSDVHFTAYVNLHPDRAEGNFTDFKPLDEFVIGPIHAGSFGPNFMDTSFGAKYEFELGPLTLGLDQNLPPEEFRLQTFGHAEVAEDGTLTIQLIGIDGEIKFNKTLTPEEGVSGVRPITETDVFIQSGEISQSSAIIMARCNAEVDSNADLLLNGEQLQRGQALEAHDYTVSFKVENLESNTKYTYQVMCTPLSLETDVAEGKQGNSVESVEGSFKTAPAADEEVPFSFVWCADLAGQGWGRNPNFEVTTVDGKRVQGGYVVFDVMESLEPDFAVFQGDMIYADNAIPPSIEIPTGGLWINNPSKDFVAVTLDEFRANWKYNFGDTRMQSFLAKTPIFVQWDDHEVSNNWWPDEILSGPLYPNGTAANSLYQNSLQAFYEFNPIEQGQKIYRSQRYGKHLEIFFPDYRSYRDSNAYTAGSEYSTMLGEEQLAWLKESLSTSNATWKIISSHDPFGIVTGSDGDRDAWGQEMPEILGRELELKDILEHIYTNNIVNVVSLSSDVHFTAYVNMHPDRAEGGFKDFKPLDEFVIGPIHAGSFGPNTMDSSFGAQYEFELGPATLGFDSGANLPPSEVRLQSFGHVAVAEDGTLRINLIGIDGDVKFNKTLTPEDLPPQAAPVDSPTPDNGGGTPAAAGNGGAAPAAGNVLIATSLATLVSVACTFMLFV